MSRTIVPNVIYTPSTTADGTCTIVLPDYPDGIRHQGILMIYNITRRTALYVQTDPLSSITVNNNIITVTPGLDTTGHSSTDIINVTYDTRNNDPVQTELLVNTERMTWREDFATNLSDWNLTPTTGGGITSSIASSLLTINAGTVANDTWSIRSKKGFYLPARAQILIGISQRIINQTFYFDIINAAGDTMASWLFGGTVAGTNSVVAMNKNFKGTADTAVTTTGTSATPVLFEIDLRSDMVDFYDRGSAETGQVATIRATRNRTIPQPEEMYYAQIRVVNGGTAPASNTVITVEMVLVQANTKTVVEISSGRGNTALVHSVPVAIVSGNVGITGNPTMSVRGNAQTTAASITLASNATHTGASYDEGSSLSSRSTRLRWFYQATAATIGGLATLIYEESVDNITWRETNRLPMPTDGLPHTGEWIRHLQWWRIRVINGTTAITSLYVYSDIDRGDGLASDFEKNLVLPLTPLVGTSIAASGTFTSPVIDLGVNHQFNTLRSFIKSDQTGSMQLQWSTDGTNFYSVSPNMVLGGTISSPGVSLTANQAVITEMPIALRYIRLLIINGTTAATAVIANLDLVSL